MVVLGQSADNEANGCDENEGSAMRRIAPCVFTWIVFAFACPVEASIFFGLGDFSGGTFFSRAADVSADGSVVVGWSDPGTELQGFRWTATTGLEPLGPRRAHGVSGDGSVAVGVNGSAWAWTQATGQSSIGNILGGKNSRALGVSADGQVIVGNGQNALGFGEAFRWTESGGMVGLDDLPGSIFQSIAFAASGDGSVVVGSGHSSNGQEAFRWTQATGIVGLGDLPGGDFDSRAYSITPDGSVIVGQADASGEEGQAFRWTEATGIVGLGDLPGGRSLATAFDVSADGSVIVGLGFSDIGPEAFMWDADRGMRTVASELLASGVDLAGWSLSDARGVSADGLTIVGYGENPDGHTEAWVARLDSPKVVPEPSTIAIWSLLALGLTVMRRRRLRL